MVWVLGDLLGVKPGVSPERRAHVRNWRKNQHAATIGTSRCDGTWADKLSKAAHREIPGLRIPVSSRVLLVAGPHISDRYWNTIH